MKLFGYKLVRAERYDQLLAAEIKWRKTIEVTAWFSGWKDLRIIWNYLREDVNFGGIERARRDYADARGTNEYGEVDQ